jgi:LacI family transcriptional regulator
MPTKKRTVTIQGVAKAAGVSVSTVSRVLNARADVASDTQDRIRAVIEELGYTSNLAARSMRSHKKNLIGLVVPDIGFPYAIEIMKGINRAIAESSFDLILYTTGDFHKNGTASHEQHYVSLLNNSMTDGVIIVASSVADFITEAPIVAVDPHVIIRSRDELPGCSRCYEFSSAFRASADWFHLWSTGNRKRDPTIKWI